MRGSRTAALLSGLTAALALTACGVPPSGVIEAGAPASGMFPPDSASPTTPATVSLFFLRDGELTPYPRRADDAGDLGAVIRLLFEGPAGNETATATTELPRPADAPRVAIADDGALSVWLPGETEPLSRQAVLQLTCTVNHAAPSAPTLVPRVETEADDDTARDSAAPSSLQVLGEGWTMTQPDDACPVAPRQEEQPEAPTSQKPSG
ncbi:hypothetical protein B7767_03595 [Streptomyces sp. 13-12-16]|uniref:hypothetical protein n=1 Tax=Streptomyces sp. 13-12-16 TaxID=1570823 RepID=UPI000A1DD37D|nr:hypothetical protein [Streptomyces sp. 13-12-16]OSP44649.1 hypothetical protein B7767_03595 [Streptomyces sp. 13-12-16]